jgi:DNA-binding XRE family transcriptional regulator
MLAHEVVEKVRYLLAEGSLSQRKIALRVGISRNTVHAIAQGKVRDRDAAWKAADPSLPLGPPRRCPTCGGMVFMPCLLCHIRAIKEAQAKRARIGGASDG